MPLAWLRAQILYKGHTAMKLEDETLLSGGRKPAKIGPSDTSDTVSDRPGEPDSDTDAEATGERVTAGIDPNAELHEAEYGADRVVGSGEAGLGGGLDEAEEARLGSTDEELRDEWRQDKADSEEDEIAAPPPGRK
jgi:hypothetical protein